MSKEGWQEFLRAEGVEDWVVLHGGATAALRIDSMADSARLAAAIAASPELDEGILMTVASDRLTARLTREVSDLETRHIDTARAVSAVAPDQGASPDRSAVQEVQVAVSAKPDEVDLGFWQVVLGYTKSADDAAADPLGYGSTVWMQELDGAKPLRHAMHFDVSLARDEAESRLEAAVAAGGLIVDDYNAPRWRTLSDRVGNRVCIVSWPDGAS